MSGIGGRIAAEAGDAPGGASIAREPLTPAAQAKARVAAAQARAMAAEEGVQAAISAGPGRPRKRSTERVPFGAHQQRLKWDEIPGYRLYWFNDTPGRVGDALRAGYEHVKDERGQNVSRNVGRGEGSQNGMTAFLMKIPNEWYEEDMAAEQDKLAERLHDIRQGRGQGEGQYVSTRHQRQSLKSRLPLAQENPPAMI